MLGPELPFITFGSRLSHSHLSTPYHFSPLSFYLFPPPHFAGGRGMEKFTFHKRLWHVIKLWIVAMFRAPLHILSGEGVPYCGTDFVAVDILSPFCMECGKLIRRRWQRQNCQRWQNHLFTQLSCFRFPILSSFISLLFLAQPRLLWGHFRSGTLALSPTLYFLPLPHGSYAENCLKGNRVVGSCK